MVSRVYTWKIDKSETIFTFVQEEKSIRESDKF